MENYQEISNLIFLLLAKIIGDAMIKYLLQMTMFSEK